jgi:predicted nucleic acid-binding protein
MNGDKLFLDTNIIIYLLNGDKTLSELLHGKTAYVSFITQLELLSYSGITQKESLKIREFLQECVVIDINDSIKEKIVTLRKLYGLKLPDSIIAGTALFHDIPLISADKDFTRIDEVSVVYYEK